MRAQMNINPESARQAEERFRAALENLDGALKDRRFLVGDRFSRADLTACALLRPLCAPGRTDQDLSAAMPDGVLALRNAQKSRLFFSWVRDVYATRRQARAV
jgi:glutathione S-transferase